ncbi:MAG: hypothetical protein Fues2KO_05070 [Fuerstiella sp.]
MNERQAQSAALLSLLGDEAAEAVLSHMRPELAGEIRSQLTAEQNVGLKAREKRELMKDFEWFFDFALKVKPTELKVVSEEAEAERLAEEEAAAEAAAGADADKEIELTGDPLHDLTLLSIFQLAGALETEQPRTVALLLNNVSPELAANILSYLPDDQRVAVTRQLSKEQNAPRLLVERIARATVQRGLTLPAEAPDRRDHLDRLSEVLREVPKSYRKDMMAAIEEEDAEMMAALLKKLYRFEDIKDLDPSLIQQILGEIDGTTLTTAMYQADDELVETILGNLSRRARTTIEEELQFQSRLPDSKVRAAREAVAELIAKLDQEEE